MADKLAKCWLEPMELASSRRFRAHELNEVRDLVLRHRDEFLEAWHEHSTPIAEPMAIDAKVDGAMLRVTLEDGREIAVPTAWFPRLRDATPDQAANWRLIGRGEGIHWPEIDEDIQSSR